MDNTTKDTLLARLTVIANELSEIEKALIQEGEDYPKGRPTFNPEDLDPSYPLYNKKKFKDALDEINSRSWDQDNYDHYRRYRFLKGGMKNTMISRGLTSVPLGLPEPNWNKEFLTD